MHICVTHISKIKAENTSVLHLKYMTKTNVNLCVFAIIKKRNHLTSSEMQRKQFSTEFSSFSCHGDNSEYLK